MYPSDESRRKAERGRGRRARRELRRGGRGLRAGQARVGMPERGAAKDVAGECLLDLVECKGLSPVERRELEDVSGRPAREQAEQVAEVLDGLDAVELAAGEQRDESGVGLAALVEEAAERDAVIAGVTDRARDRCLIERTRSLGVDPIIGNPADSQSINRQILNLKTEVKDWWKWASSTDWRVPLERG
jgi:hypothetical protein